MAFRNLPGLILLCHVLLPASGTGTACPDVAAGAVANPDLSASEKRCMCPVQQGVRGTDAACLNVFGKRNFNPDALDNKNCQCVDKVTLFFTFFTDHLYSLGNDYEANIAKLNGWLSDVRSKSEEVVAKLEERWVEIKEGVAQNIEQLRAQWQEASQQVKEELQQQMTRLKDKLDEVRRAIEELLRESVQKVSNAARTFYTKLKNDVTALAQAAAKALRERLLELQACAISNTPSRQILEVSTELVSGEVGSLRVQIEAATLSFNFNLKWELEAKIPKFGEQLKLLKSAAINKGKEIGAAFARFLEFTSARIGELREQLKTAVANKRQAIQAEIAMHTERLESYLKVAADQSARFRARISKSVEGLAEDLGYLQEWLTKEWNILVIPFIQAQVDKYKNHLSQLRSEALLKQAEVEVRLMQIMTGVSTRIGQLKEQLKEAVGETKVEIEAAFMDLKLMFDQLKQAAIRKHEAVKLQVASLRAKLVEYIARLQERINTATQDKKAVLGRALAQARDLLSRIASAAGGVVDDVRTTLEALLIKLRSMHVEAREDVRDALSETIRRLEEQMGNLTGNATLDDNVGAVACESAVALAEYFGQLDHKNITQSVEQLAPYLQQLQSVLADVGGQVEVLLTDAVELISVSAGELKYSLIDAGTWDIILGLTPSSKAEVELQLEATQEFLSKLRTIASDLKSAQEEELSKAAETLGEKLGTFQEKFAVAVADGKELFQQTILDLQGHLSDLMSSAGNMRAVLEDQLLDLAGIVAAQVGEFNERVKQAAQNQKAALQEQAEKLKARLISLREVAAQKFEEGKGALEAVADAIGERLGELMEQLKTATGAFRAELQIRIQQLRERLEQIWATGKDLMGKVREQTVLATEKVSEFVGEQREKLVQAAQAQKKAIEDRLIFYQQRLATVQAKMTEQWQAKYAAAVHHMEERISRWTAKLEAAASDAKIALQNKINEYSTKLQQLKLAVENRFAAIHETLASLAERMTVYINELKDKLRSAAAQVKSRIQTRIADLEALFAQLQTAITLKTEDAIRAALRAFIEKLEALEAALGEKDVDPYADTFSDWCGRLHSAADDEGIADIVGAATTSDMIDMVTDELEAEGSSRRLSEDEGEGVQGLRNNQAELWKVVETRSKEAENVPDFEPLAVPTPPPEENPFLISSAITKSLGLSVSSATAIVLAIGF